MIDFKEWLVLEETDVSKIPELLKNNNQEEFFRIIYPIVKSTLIHLLKGGASF